MWSIKVRIPSFVAVKVRAGRYVKMLGWVALLTAVTGLTSWLVAAVMVALYHKLSKLTEREAVLGRSQAAVMCEVDGRGRSCVVCLAAPPSTVLLPCRHLCCCLTCSNTAGMTKCPICRSHIRQRIEVCYA